MIGLLVLGAFSSYASNIREVLCSGEFGDKQTVFAPHESQPMDQSINKRNGYTCIGTVVPNKNKLPNLKVVLELPSGAVIEVNSNASEFQYVKEIKTGTSCRCGLHDPYPFTP